MPIFQDAHGMAIKFFIQKDIPQEIQADVCETIAALGGRVEPKVPRAGFVLVQPGTAEEERLRLCWSTPERPERYFVPYSYVEACKVSGMLLKQIFLHEGKPIRMHIDSSIANVNVRATLATRIMHSGGDPTASAQLARVILADPNTEIFQHLVKTYQGEPEKYVESYLWVKKCIEKGQVIYTPVVYKNPGGRRPGEERTQFTEQDEEHLCDWIAAKIPYKETGGRTGNRLYQQLCEMAHDPEYSWVTRHTWQSWRERYKKNATRLDAKIAQIVDQKKPAHGEKGQYGYVRKPEEKPKRVRKKKSAMNDDSESPMAGLSTVHSMETYSVPMPVPVPLGGVLGPLPGPNDTFNPVAYSTPPPVFHNMSMPTPVTGQMDAATARQNAREEEMEDDDEWAIREGNAPTPAWAKRKADAEESPNKRARTNPPEAVAPPLHPIDQAVQDIAKEFRFTVEEVQEYYDKCGDPERTKNRFKKMRDVLNTLMDDDEEQSQPIV
ncbi:hypothetical protein L226DRAFT_549322 [Lentinus tigrinus ALCF2SS1-7]|uniref:DNA-binding protein RAP1 n=1 Tax=Lentinus tigrinus ALCF2SS1-6 TaxID=1328759 RepID=A0A5C2SH95_9APHY|nr:hypothetical protein L227DRAFT_572903 [Lentinus tigrinus ALCF2SS1-6]RPD82667.1 hypothetical protein L226DRAFT_549322 [Lentinus tigrinus ALCF2SS1-7]